MISGTPCRSYCVLSRSVPYRTLEIAVGDLRDDHRQFENKYICRLHYFQSISKINLVHESTVSDAVNFCKSRRFAPVFSREHLHETYFF